MSTDALGQSNNEIMYRSICKSAVVCAIFAFIGLTAFLSPIFILFPILAVVFGFAGMKALRRYPDELMGKPVVWVGMIVGLITVALSLSLHIYIYNTEVPEGYERISFSQLMPNKKSMYPYSEDSMKLNGKKVFLKGYVRPSDRKHNLKKFILVGDFGSCCFGGNPKITDVVAINIVADETVNYSFRKRKIGGNFSLNANPKQIDEKDIPQVFYEIHADYLY